MLRRAELLEDIRLASAVLQGCIRVAGSLHLADINIHAEDFVCEPLNIVNNWSFLMSMALIRIAHVSTWSAGARARRSGVQVTTGKGVKKIKESHTCCAANLAGMVETLYVFGLLPKQTKYSVGNISANPALSDKNTLDFDSMLLALKSTLDDNKLASARKFVASQLRPHFPFDVTGRRNCAIRSHAV